MKCAYHSTVDSREFCSTCSKALCAQCAHQIKGKFYCEDCLVQGAQWAASIKDLRLPADSAKRAALCALIPGMGAVYNNEYLKAVTYFAVFAALSMMGDRVNGVFGFGAFVFIIFTMFDAYRTAEARSRARLQGQPLPQQEPEQDRTIVGWGIFLMALGVLFLLQNIIPYYFLSRMWPIVFILLGAYLVYRSLQDKQDRKQGARNSSVSLTEPKEF